ncbi:hypothetical protein NBH00_04060 [Paraconexibacter antarcticus]|uniref:Serine/threonine-protein kinase RsbW n=1 Tax=Paraconexibacter antarcticus TaxID=2949664 RepID=A0ABY5DTN4_9ACTN|nr:hypothetical protein [Paraconexibacter antarcticus]UTI65391.1 hypothetical protein NBH00_04060 [Paraconexibacter antarcticus]
MSTLGGARDGPAAADSLERARLTVRCGPLARSLASRFVAALGAETSLSVDRVDEAGMLAAAVADRCVELTPDGELDLTVAVREDLLELRVGPLEPGSGARLLGSDATLPGGGPIRGFATSVDIRRTRNGRDLLRVVVAAHPPGR